MVLSRSKFSQGIVLLLRRDKSTSIPREWSLAFKACNPQNKGQLPSKCLIVRCSA